MKKTKFLLLAAALTAGLSACSGGQTQETAAAQTEQESAAQTEASAQSSEEAGTETAESQESTEAAEEESAADDWAARSIEAGKVSSREELTFPIGDQVSGAFTGTVYLTPMIMNDETYNFPQTNNVTFEPGARSYWHSHGGMLLVGTGGVGYYQEEGKPAQIIRKGDVVECPEGVRHWHGAAPDSWFSQMVIYDSHYTPEGGVWKSGNCRLHAPGKRGQRVYVPESGRSHGVGYLQRPRLCLQYHRRGQCGRSAGPALCGL